MRRQATASAVTALLIALALWSLGALGLEAYRTARDSLGSNRNFRLASRWLLGSRQVETLRQFLVEVGQATPPGSPIGFVSYKSGTADGFFCDSWAAYLLPDRPVIPAAEPAARGRVRYLAAYRTHRDDPHLVAIKTMPDGILYRVTP
jgi:hypothetical protein